MSVLSYRSICLALGTIKSSLGSSALFFSIHGGELYNHKKLCAYEARPLMLSEHTDVTIASYKVGYESPSQFSREYRRLFGLSPSRDIRNIKLAANSA